MHTINYSKGLEPDVVVGLWKVQVMVEEKEETAFAAVWVTDGIYRCRVGFLHCHMVKQAAQYNGVVVQVTRVFSSDAGACDLVERRMYHHNRGCCLTTIISGLPVVSSTKNEGKDNN